MTSRYNMTDVRNMPLRRSLYLLPPSGVPASVAGIAASLKVKSNGATLFELTVGNGITFSIQDIDDPRKDHEGETLSVLVLKFVITIAQQSLMLGDESNYTLSLQLAGAAEPEGVSFGVINLLNGSF